ncbi:hypothetical protein [Arthrobacter sp. ISL-30]|uniref:hypothetical protein n=1 Tax=Arthrobacter sp. ISL-30 TaxID=2819109 RepID=UPI001BE6F7BE|nr:hypothetical protein [Arthrobacter sp. ISL-30]MBT2512303.1 hypothetical protein [Arthrobacter sp. ISL-30]
MSISSSARLPNPAGQHPEQRPWCGVCQSDKRLKIDAIETASTDDPHIVMVTYACAQCGSLYTHEARVEDVAAILNSEASKTAVLKFGNFYIHCGAPMTVAGTELRSIYVPISTDKPSPTPGNLLDVYLRTRVLRCACGFQMEIPR